MNRIIKTAAGISRKMRKKRYEELLSMLSSLEGPLDILDVGGTEDFWRTVGFNDRQSRIVLMNLDEVTVESNNMTSEIGDARDMSQYAERQFDVVISNSVIEHVGSFEDQQRMAREIRRVGQRYILQTPSAFFPIEPHFFIPFFQFLPIRLRLFLGTRLDFSWFKGIRGEEKVEFIKSLRLMKRKELELLFPDATLKKEKFLGITKSFTLMGGW